MRSSRALRTTVAATVVALFAACSSGDGDGLDENGRPLDGTGDGGSGAPVQPTFRSIQDQVFTVTCAVSGCHSGASAPLGLRLDAGSSIGSLIGRPSEQQPTLLRVDPGDPDNSYLVRKIEGTAASGAQMPRNQPPLPVETIQAIRDWIAAGALVPTLSSIQRNVFTPICTACHFGPSPAAQMSLEEGRAHAQLVGVQRAGQPEIRVVPGEASASFLIDKLEGNELGGPRGDRMPLGGPFLDQAIIDVIRSWIDQGAEAS